MARNKHSYPYVNCSSPGSGSVSAGGGDAEGRGPELVGGLDVGAGAQHEPGRVGVAVEARLVQRSPPARVALRHVRAQ